MRYALFLLLALFPVALAGQDIRVEPNGDTVRTYTSQRLEQRVDSVVRVRVVTKTDTLRIPFPAEKPSEPVVVPPPLGLPMGAFHLPISELNGPSNMTGTLRYGETPGRLAALLDSVKRVGGRIAFAPTTKRAEFIVKPADRTKPPYFSVALWTKEFDAVWGSSFALLKAAIADGRIHLVYAADEPDCATCWYKDNTQGTAIITPQHMDSVARHLKHRLGEDARTFIRVVPWWFGSYTPQWIDGAWGQYEGRYHVPSGGMTPEQFRDKNVAEAKARGLALVLGLNLLDGGDGPCSPYGDGSKLPGTFYPDPDPNDALCHPSHNRSYYRYQVSAAEYERAYKAFIEEPYVCAVLGWRWSGTFGEQPDVKAATARLRELAAARNPGPCRRP